MSPRRADLLLVSTCAIWGLSFPMVKVGLDDASPLAYVAIRFAIGALALLPGTRVSPAPRGAELRAGLVLGVLLATGFAAQGVGLEFTTPARSAFIVAMSSILAPIVAFVAVRERMGRWTVVALAIAAAGMYFLTDPDAGGLNRGDLWTLLTALAFGGQIVAVRELGLRHDVRRLVLMQTAFTAVAAGVAAALLETPHVTWTPRLLGTLAYTGIGATALALLLQMRAQRHMSSARAALLFCTEPVFATVASWLWLGERLSVAQWSGGALIVGGMILADLPARRAS
ncbi:MAG TPA: DMT family transporter [Gemmatimonadales bacterium]